MKSSDLGVLCLLPVLIIGGVSLILSNDKPRTTTKYNNEVVYYDSLICNGEIVFHGKSHDVYFSSRHQVFKVDGKVYTPEPNSLCIVERVKGDNNVLQ